MNTLYETGGERQYETQMICQHGRIERIEDDVAFVRLEAPTSCEGCGSKGTCGVVSAEGKVIGVRNDAGAKPGQRVELSVRPKALLTASFLLFLVPVLALVAGIVGGYALAEQFGWQGREWIGLGLGAAAFALVLLIIKLLNTRFERSGKYEPVISRILD
ncbi:MAG TPA: SoxR reducing system RseC family protein [Acidobacteriota bacterium]|nr:SoxR reducing system RseC family protein [Acidobacteriota bacterium]